MKNSIYYININEYQTFQFLLQKARFIMQGTKKFRSESPGLVNFAVGLVDFILYLPNRQVKILGSHTNKNFLG